MNFKFDADATIVAENLDDAFRKIGDYYINLARGYTDQPPLIEEGYVRLRAEADNGS